MKRPKTVDRLIDLFRTSASALSARGIIDDDDAQLVAVAWQFSSPEWVGRERAPREATPESWEWLWQRVRLDAHGLSKKSGVAPTSVRRALQKLIGLRLIYPDGTLHPDAVAAVRRTTVARSPILRIPKGGEKPKRKAAETGEE